MSALDLLLKDYPTRECKGLVYRYRENHYVNAKRHIVTTKRLVPMKKLSCDGCSSCGGILEFAADVMIEYPMDKMVDGELYEMNVETVVWQTDCGPEYDSDIVFTPYKGGNQK